MPFIFHLTYLSPVKFVLFIHIPLNKTQNHDFGVPVPSATPDTSLSCTPLLGSWTQAFGCGSSLLIYPKVLYNIFLNKFHVKRTVHFVASLISDQHKNN